VSQAQLDPGRDEDKGLQSKVGKTQTMGLWPCCIKRLLV
jgi:hypothetical protein